MLCKLNVKQINTNIYKQMEFKVLFPLLITRTILNQSQNPSELNILSPD